MSREQTGITESEWERERESVGERERESGREREREWGREREREREREWERKERERERERERGRIELQHEYIKSAPLEEPVATKSTTTTAATWLMLGKASITEG